MLQVLDPFRFVLIAVAGWMNQWEYVDHRLPARGEPGSARATRRTSAAV
jgi:hypothetical protein